MWCGVVVLDFLSERVNVCGFELSTIGLWLFWSSTLVSQLNQSSDDYIYIRIINFCAFVRACVNHLVVVIHTTIVFYCFLFYLLWTFHCAYLACVQILSSLSIFHFLLHQHCVSLMAICFLFFEFVHLCHNFNYFLSSLRLLRSLALLFVCFCYHPRLLTVLLAIKLCWSLFRLVHIYTYVWLRIKIRRRDFMGRSVTLTSCQ